MSLYIMQDSVMLNLREIIKHFVTDHCKETKIAMKLAKLSATYVIVLKSKD